MSEWVTTDIPAFDKWWEEHGQFVRAGGGGYERTFAYEAVKALTNLAPTAATPKRHYFVAYQWTNERSGGHGCMDISRSNPIGNFADVEELCSFIANYKGFKTVVITNWQHYEEE